LSGVWGAIPPSWLTDGWWGLGLAAQQQSAVFGPYRCQDKATCGRDLF
jgi:hypothetical protein